MQNAFVHSGFFDAYTSVRDQVVLLTNLLIAKVKATQVMVTGHSLGAAMASKYLGVLLLVHQCDRLLALCLL